jgi:hypothetical protein
MVEFSAGTKAEATPHNRKPLGVEIEFEKKREKICKRNVKYTLESNAVQLRIIHFLIHHCHFSSFVYLLPF